MQSGQLRRREFISLVGGAVSWPFAVRAQQPGKLPTVGYLGQSTPLGEGERAVAFAQRLRELGWIEGRTVAIEYRWAEGRSERLAEIAAEFVRSKVDIIITGGVPAAVAAKQATPVIPIVFATASDPVRAGLVASLARPGGNVTGLSALTIDLAGKRVSLLREAIAGFGRLAIMGNVGNPLMVLELGELQAAARELGLQVDTLEIQRPQDIAPALETVKGRAQALYVCLDLLTLSNRLRINTLALGARLPVMHASREHIEAAGLMSYGPNFLDSFRRAGEYVDKILRGAKPADLPVEQPTKFELVINLITAKTLGLTIAPTLLARADEVIE
jgi:putative ABC transport system substrate-binding protein